MNVSDMKRYDLRRRNRVPVEGRTKERAVASNWLETELVDKGRWPVELVQLADESGWSRQHIKNTLDYYFEPVRDEQVDDVQTEIIQHDNGRIQIDIPADVDKVSYLRGYLDGVTRE